MLHPLSLLLYLIVSSFLGYSPFGCFSISAIELSHISPTYTLTCSFSSQSVPPTLLFCSLYLTYTRVLLAKLVHS